MTTAAPPNTKNGVRLGGSATVVVSGGAAGGVGVCAAAGGVTAAAGGGVCSMGDGPAARDLAERACRLTERKTAVLLDALAAALAETGRFDDAIKTLERAIELARSSNRLDVLSAMRSRLADYHARRPYRMPTR